MSTMNYTRLVDVVAIAPRIIIDMRYATSDNFTQKVIYASHRAYLLKHVAEALKKVSDECNALGYALKIWDAYRPLQAQHILWNLVPDERYVADPKKGSRHNRGCAVDVTLVDSNGNELDMGTAFDDFSQKAHRDYTQLSDAVIKNRNLLQNVMERNGFIGWHNEWWHFDYADWEQHPILDVPLV
jgi:zinc D-Ala-D-Ala dipeptidase